MVSWKNFQSANSVSFHVQLADEPEKSCHLDHIRFATAHRGYAVS